MITQKTDLCSTCKLKKDSRCIKDGFFICSDYMKVEPIEISTILAVLDAMKILLEKERFCNELDIQEKESLYLLGVNRGILTGLNAIESIEEYLESKENEK